MAIYVEEGVSAKTMNRPQFLRMLADAESGEKPFDKILVHNTSRFARNSGDYAMVEKRLARLGIEVEALSQTFGKDAGGMISKRVSTAFDEYHSIRSAVDSMRARRRMVDDGHWPGGRPPYGFMLVPAGDNPKRKWLVQRDEEARMAGKIYSLCLHGDGEGPPLGLQKLADWLNDRGYRTREGSTWSIQAIHSILTNPVYYGEYWWNVSPAENDHMEDEGPVLLRVAPTVSQQQFQQVQALLQERNPEMGAAKLTSSPLLLAGIARCKCGASMTLGTGRGHLGVDYRYYRCSGTNRRVSRCGTPWIPEKSLDDLVEFHQGKGARREAPDRTASEAAGA